MASGTSDITFIVPGQAQPAPRRARPTARHACKASVRVGTQRGGGEPVRVTARPGEDVVVLSIANGPTLVLHPGRRARPDARAERGGDAQRAAAATRGGAPSEVAVPAQLGWPGLEAEATRGSTRGWLGQAVLSGFEVVTGLAKDPAAKLVAAALDEEGRRQGRRRRLRARRRRAASRSRAAAASSTRCRRPPTAGRCWCFVHGTFSDTVGTFGKLWTLHTATRAPAVRQLRRPRLRARPSDARRQPDRQRADAGARAARGRARCTSSTHSRGGLVAEVLARACGGDAARRRRARRSFAGADYAEHRSDLRALVERSAGARHPLSSASVRVGLPGARHAARVASGSTPTCRCSSGRSSWPACRCVPAAGRLPGRGRAPPRRARRAARPRGDDPRQPAGRSGCNARRATPIPGELRVVAGDIEGDSVGSWVKTLLSDAFYWTDNDLVVQTRSMYGGAPRASGSGSGARFVLDQGGKVSHFNYFSNERTAQAIASALLARRAGRTSGDRAAVVGRRGRERHARRRAVARSRGAAAARGGAPTGRRCSCCPASSAANLKRDGKRIWLGLRIVNGLKQLAWDPATAASVEPDGPIGSVYDDLIERLADTPRGDPVRLRLAPADRGRGARASADAVDAALDARARPAGSRCASSPTRWAAWSRARCSSSSPRPGSA